MSNGEFVSNGRMGRLVQPMLRSLIVTEDVIMGRVAIHPGGHLAEQLDSLGMSAAELGRQLKMPTNRITEILNGQRSITGDTALRLGHFSGTSAQFWPNLQTLFDLRTAAQRRGPTSRICRHCEAAGIENTRPR